MMADVVVEVMSTTPSKRNYEGEIIDKSNNNIIIDTTSESTNQATSIPRSGSPAPSSVSSLTELSSIAAPNSSSLADSSAPPTKKRKLTFIEREAEKAARKREKEEKEKARADEKARKDEERKQKMEEKRKQAEDKEAVKRVKEIEKAEKQKIKDAEKQEKDAKKQEKEAEKARKEADKVKKERAQMRIGTFFGRPAPISTPPITPDDASEGTSSRRSSLASIDMQPPAFNNKVTPHKNTTSEYEKWILPFFVPEYTDLAPPNRFQLGKQIDFPISTNSNEDYNNVRLQFRKSHRRRRQPISVRKVMEKWQECQNHTTESDFDPNPMLDRVQYKYFCFREDVRPPYQGTFTRPVSPRTSRRISRNPFKRDVPDTNYDYDSEAEWEPPGEDDEDLNDEDEMSEADDNEDEMEDFLDDENDIGRKKGPICDMQPISSGICWENEEYNDNGHNLQQYKIDVLHDNTSFPIDPFAGVHWTDEVKPKPQLPKAKPEPTTNSMQPPRLPLTSLSPNTIISIMKKDDVDTNSTPAKQKGRSPNPDKPTKMIEAEFLPAFKQAINGSDLTKAGLVEILKKQFPKCSKDAIKDTLGVVAVRVGKKEAEKKWELVV